MRRHAARRLARNAARVTNAPMGLLMIRGGASFDAAGFGTAELEVLEQLAEEPFEVGDLDRVLLVPDMRAEPRFVQSRLASLATSAVSFAVVPIEHEGNRVGALAVMDVRPRAWTAAQVESLLDVAGIAADEFEMRERRLAEVASERRTNALFRGMLEHFPNGSVVVFDRDTRIVAAGGRSAYLTAADVLGKTIREVLGDVPHAAATEVAYRNVFEGESSTAEQTFGGHVLLVHRRPIRSDDGAILAGMVVSQDITPRVNAEAALRETEERYRALFEKAGEAIFIIDEEPGSAGRILDVNEAGLRLHGYSREELLAMTSRALLAPDQMASADTTRERVLNGEWARAELLQVKKDGTVFPMEATSGSIAIGGKRRIVAFVRDISERLKAEAALRESEERYHALFEKVGEAIYIAEPEGGRIGTILDLNPAAVALHGYSREEMLQKRMYELLAPGEPHVPAELRQRALGGAWIRSTVVHANAQGARFPVELTLGSLEIGRQRRFLVILRDLTERMKVEDALHSALNATDAANRAKSVFLANMSHEIRTPMNAIVGYSELLQRDQTLRAAQREQLGIIQRAGDHLLALINDILEISKIEAGHRTLQVGQVEVARMLSELDTMFQLPARAKNLELTVRSAPDLPIHVAADETKLRQVLVNLVGNAVKFTATGRVTVRAERVIAASGNSELIVEVEDTGPGIEPRMLDELFKAFSQGRAGLEAKGGTGLGLAISRENARMMGGDVTVTSELGAGSVFRFSMPCVEAVTVARPLGSVAPMGRVVGVVDDGNPWRVLVVDDDDDSRGWLSVLLAEVGFDVRQAANGLDGVELVVAWRPHVVMMDVNMPVMSGYDAMRAIRAMPRDEQPSIIAVTASVFDDQQAEIRAAGADAALRKPCREREVFQELERQLGLTYKRAPLEFEGLSMIPATGSVLPKETALALCDAATVADYEKLLGLIDGLSEDHAALATSLRELADRYAYDEIKARLRD